MSVHGDHGFRTIDGCEFDVSKALGVAGFPISWQSDGFDFTTVAEGLVDGVLGSVEG